MWLNNETGKYRRLRNLLEDGFVPKDVTPEHLSQCDVVFTCLSEGKLSQVLELEKISCDETLNSQEKVEKVKALLSK